ncbi:beta-hexosaminidase [Vibrio sp. MACH09]|uniref:beta-N-acetylhexosaminidase n=1 Tax=Vibrio sp. MACH09 TaxID=3025122 RepID=UPI002790953A|nr:beta-N-acetylhexosaminidase [Vibrio sp. MACH09]GLO61782.1 beta-hexosaminidase [Vibrio sp. MACH09]
MGPLWLDVAGYELSQEDKEVLQHPTVGGVILFARNYYDNQQLTALNTAIRKVTQGKVLVGVDQEGGRVQRFREHFSLIPPASSFALQPNGEELAQQAGWLMAAELIAHDIDLSFAPVLDVGHQCQAIGNRAFSDNAQSVLRFSTAFMKGMKEVGMATTGKHFPGHGGVIADSHLETPYDDRRTIFEEDMAIFTKQINSGVLDAIMPAHVIYSHYDDQPASGSPYWLKEVLRKQLGFKGIVFSDDLNMDGAGIMGTPAERSQQSLDAGCDMVLMCNNRQSQIDVLDNLVVTTEPQVRHLFKKHAFTLSDLQSSSQWKEASIAMKRLLD